MKRACQQRTGCSEKCKGLNMLQTEFLSDCLTASETSFQNMKFFFKIDTPTNALTLHSNWLIAMYVNEPCNLVCGGVKVSSLNFSLKLSFFIVLTTICVTFHVYHWVQHHKCLLCLNVCAFVRQYGSSRRDYKDAQRTEFWYILMYFALRYMHQKYCSSQHIPSISVWRQTPLCINTWTLCVCVCVNLIYTPVHAYMSAYCSVCVLFFLPVLL